MLEKVGKVLDLVKRRESDGNSVYEFKSQQDPELIATFERIREKREGLEEMNDVLRSALDIQPDKGRSFIAKCLALVTPKWMYPRMPTKLLKLMAEEADALELFEGSYRNTINEYQNALITGIEVGIKKEEDYEALMKDLQKAKDENWSAQKLQAHIMERAQIKGHEAITKLLDREFGLLSDDEKEKKKQHLLLKLADIAKGNESLIQLIAKTLSADLSVLNTAIAEYYAYKEFYVPIATIRDSAEIMTQTSNTMYAAREALLYTAKMAVDAITVALEANAHVARFSLASPEVRAALEGERKRIEITMEECKVIEAAALEEGQKRLALETGKNDAGETARQITDGGTVEGEIVETPRPAFAGMRGSGGAGIG